MASRPSFACAHAWWSWDHPEIVRAVRWAWLKHLLPMVNRKLVENADTGREPKTVQGLCQQSIFRRNPRNVERFFAGDHDCSEGFKLALATALGAPVSELFPTNERWLERATGRLCGNKVELADSLVYAVFRSMLFNGQASLDNGACDLVLQDDSVRRVADSPQAVRSAVERVIAVLDPLLCRFDEDLKAKGR